MALVMSCWWRGRFFFRIFAKVAVQSEIMSILLVIPDRKLTHLVAELQQQLPQVPIVVWPDVPDPDAISFAVVWRQPAGSLTLFNNLRVLQSFGAGVDNILVDPLLPKLPLARIVDPDLTASMIQYLDTALGFYRYRFDEYINAQQTQRWHPRSRRQLKAVTVLGLGELGAAVAMHLSQQGWQVSGWSNSAKHIDGVNCYAGLAELPIALAEADVLICLLPLTSATNNLLNSETLAFCRQGVIFINVARGAIVDDDALLAALQSGQVSAACLDVFRQEPLPAEHPYWQQPNVLVTPHISAVTNAQTAVTQIVENYKRCMASLPMFNLIDQQRGY